MAVMSGTALSVVAEIVLRASVPPPWRRSSMNSYEVAAERLLTVLELVTPRFTQLPQVPPVVRCLRR